MLSFNVFNSYRARIYCWTLFAVGGSLAMLLDVVWVYCKHHLPSVGISSWLSFFSHLSVYFKINVEL